MTDQTNMLAQHCDDSIEIMMKDKDHHDARKTQKYYPGTRPLLA
jgi:hypothetical protein